MQPTLRRKQLVKTGLTLFLLLLIACITCNEFFYSVEQWLIQKRMHQRSSSLLRSKGLEKIAIHAGNSSQLQWKEKDEEFYLDNVLYDIVSKQVYADSTVYCCIRDKEEQQVINKLNFLVKQEHDKTPRVFSQMLKILFALYFTAPALEYPYISTEEEQVNFTYADRPHFLWHCLPDVPPPWSR